VLEGVRDDALEGLEGAEHDPRVDVVVVVEGDGPVELLGVVDDELHVGGHGGGLDGREVCGFDGGVREEVAHLDRPGSGSGADVEDVEGRRGGGEGGWVG